MDLWDRTRYVLFALSLRDSQPIGSNHRIFEPMRLYRQFSGYEPIRLHQLLDSLREPASVVLLPSVSTKNETWHDGEETPPLIRMDGFYVVSNGKSQGKVTGAEADGTRYVNYDHVYQYPLYVYGKHGSGTAPDLTLNLHKPNTRMRLKALTVSPLIWSLR